ncbi:uncharacterized protein G2W53_025967 [Senna tora]|uniref:Uncharacterized protein n=1 Tax=Senna tora TaxID=362788 RepID=A0A834TE68_9FABA|nr:uncharacterized protein G2W53_025967 [Senna tora]
MEVEKAFREFELEHRLILAGNNTLNPPIEQATSFTIVPCESLHLIQFGTFIGISIANQPPPTPSIPLPQIHVDILQQELMDLCITWKDSLILKVWGLSIPSNRLSGKLVWIWKLCVEPSYLPYHKRWKK